MSYNLDKVTFVRYGFNTVNLFAGLSSSDRYQSDESARKYQSMCEKALRLTFPKAEIEIAPRELAEGTLPDSSETVVYAWDEDLDQEAPNLEMAGFVDQQCERIFNDQKWLVPKDFIPIVETKTVSPAIVRWVCINRLITGYRHSGSTLEILRSELQTIEKHTKLIDRAEFDEIIGHIEKNMTYYLYDTEELLVARLPENTQVLVPIKEQSDPFLMKPDTILFLITRMGSVAYIQIEHFIDVSGWTHSLWSYDAYTNALIEQAKRRGVDAGYQIRKKSANKVVDSFWIRLATPLNEILTIQLLVKRAIKFLFEVSSDTELTLRGKQAWDAVYEKDEQRFCKEILEKLLHKMGFLHVRYTHGNDERGRDFVFAEETRFGGLRYYALQAKAGDIRGGARSKIDDIIRQIDEAFSVGYKEVMSENSIFISTMVLAISGKFTGDAQEIIMSKLPRNYSGSIIFLDKDKIRSLMAYYWRVERA